MFTPTVSPEIFALRPDYSALSVVASGVRNGRSHPVTDELVASVPVMDARAPWVDGHLESWRLAYRSFGAKPQRTLCSAEALRKRVTQDGRLPSVNAVVDLYNALSVRFGLPIGGENASAYVGAPRLVRAVGDESFDTVKEGVACVEIVPTGEVVWRDDRGVTCRRWNWRQGLRTRIDESTMDMWFVLERLEPMPIASLLEVGERLVDSLRKMSPDLRASATLIDSGRGT